MINAGKLLVLTSALWAGMALAQQSDALHRQQEPKAQEPPATRTAIEPATSSLHLPEHTPVLLRLEKNVPMHEGEAVQARLVYAVYQRDRLAIAAGTIFDGQIVALEPDRKRRIAAKLRGDFTPFFTPLVAFDAMETASGRVPVALEACRDGATVLRLTPAPPRQGGFVRQQFNQAVGSVKAQFAVITGPDKKERLQKLLYSQLPYHPQTIEKGTSWTTETSRATLLEAPAFVPAVANAAPATPGSASAETMTLQAYLRDALSSATAKRGAAIHAEVSEPVWNDDKTVAVPQGARLDGEVTVVKPARWFGRAGVLRFDLTKMTLPDDGKAQSVRSSLVGIDAAKGQNLALGSEGEVKQKPENKIVAPLVLFALATRPLDRDHGAHDALGKDAVASNSLGIVGFIVGTAAGLRNLAAGIGFYGTALAVYDRYIKRGTDVAFQRDTRLVLRVETRKTAAMPIPAP